MNPSTTLAVPVLLKMKRYLTRPDDLGQVRCLSCDAGLNLHQPDVEFPDRLLGICEKCRCWSVLDLLPFENEVVLVLLPGQDLLHNIESSQAAPRAGDS